MAWLRIFICLGLFNFTFVSSAQSHDPFIIVSPEKNGTFLLTKVLKKLLKKNTHSIWSHDLTKLDLIYALFWTENAGMLFQSHTFPNYHCIQTLKKKGYKVIFLQRDPRDQAISSLHFIRDWNWQYGPFDMDLPFGQLTLDEQLHEIITGRRYGYSITKDLVGTHLPWLKQPQDFVYIARFENLVGAEGGGSREQLLEEAYKMMQFIGVQMDIEEIDQALDTIFGDSCTFRSGQIGQWKHHFTPLHIEAFKSVFGQQLIEMGYEDSYDWK